MKKRILITGAGSGFGKDAALRLAARGHDVVAAVQTPEQLAALRQAQGADIPNLDVMVLDVTVAADREAAQERQIDVLICNAAVGQTGPIAEIPMDLVRQVFEVNVFGHLALAQGFARQMALRRSGRIVFASSIAGLVSSPFFGAYCASKHAIEAIAQAMRAELKPFGISIAVANPGPYGTGFNERMMATWRAWHDERTNFTKPEHMGLLAKLPPGQALPPEMQSDPAEVTELYVRLAEEEGGKFRNVIPAPVEARIRLQQAALWDELQ